MTTVNGKLLINAELHEVRVGAWSAELDVDDEDALSGGAVEIEIDGVTWSGTIVRGAVEAGRYHAWVVGGKHGLSRQLPPKHYISSAGYLILNELMTAAGETLSPTTDQNVLGKVFTRWSRLAGTAGSALGQLAQDIGVSWRVLRDGSVWLGPESWPSSSVKYDEIERSPNRGRITIAPDAPELKPGDMLGEGKVSTVTTRLAEETVRQDILFEDAAVGGADRVRQMLVKTVESIVGRRLHHSNWYPARVVSQAADNTIDILPDDELVRGSGLSRVPLRHGLPGCTVRVKPGARVILFFEDCNAQKPAAALWPDGSSVREITITADVALTLHAPTLRVEGSLLCTGEVVANCDGLSVELAAHTHNTAMGPSGIPNP